jgi:hypothetical protein
MLQDSYRPGRRWNGQETIMDALKGDTRFRAAGLGVLAAVLACWAALSVIAALRQGTWPDEAGYIIKSWWYITGAVKPYTSEDGTWYQPLLFYVLGAWQWIIGNGIVTSRLLSVLIAAVNIGLLASFLRRLDCMAWPIAFAVVVFALTEDSIFYFSSASPYVYAVCLQLAAFHLLLSMRGSAGLAVAAGFGAVLTACYLLRINLILFIALSLAIAWVRAGKDRWRVYFCAAAIFIVTWSLLALIWGRPFIYITMWLPGVTDWLANMGVVPKLYPSVFGLSGQLMLLSQPQSLPALLAYMFGWEMMRDWILGHHVLPVAAALLATIVAAMRRIPNRGWIALLAGYYWVMLVYHHFGAQSFCPICIQAYANYFNYLGALAGGLALHGLLQTRWNNRFGGRVAMGAIAVSVVVAAAQSWSLTGVNKLPSIRNRTDSLPQQIDAAGLAIKTVLPPGSRAGFVGRDSRIPLALARADIRVPPITLSLLGSHRKLKENLTAEQQAQTLDEMRQLSMWTDSTAKEWIKDADDWLVVQRQPVDHVFPWLVWAPEAPLVKTGLERCFEQVAEKTFDQFVPPLSVAIYKRIRRGNDCLGE